MNLKFLDDIYQTIELMKSGFYYLGLLAGIHTITFAAYLAYQYMNDAKNDTESKKEQKDGIEYDQEPELPPPLPQTREPVIQMEEIADLTEQKKNYKSLLEQKRDELDTLVSQLDTVYENIEKIRERLDELNDKQSM